ncbi:MAG: hypothetical protein NT094_01275 [Candidatus Staskawiczbacteria bacterium]|nr:hypothetical protein [Candidatus Staskawiczbacteria bacterium]
MNKYIIIAIIAVVVIIVGGLFISSFVGFKPVAAPDTIQKTESPVNQTGDNQQPTNTQSADWFSKRTIVGACYIPDDSQCLEYLGKAYTQDMIKRALCVNPGAQILKTCPSGIVGGCHTLIGNQDMEIISWGYAGGGKPITPQNLSGFMLSCSMLNGLWIDPAGKTVTTPPAGK